MKQLEVKDLPLSGLKLVRRAKLGDVRGFLSRVFCAQELLECGWTRPIAQINHTYTQQKGSVRGLHFQYSPHSEMKLVSILAGEVWDVAVDLRKGSRTFLHWHGELLSANNRSALLIPEGFAHGFQTLTDEVAIIYCHSSSYNGSAESGLNALDAKLGIEWPLPVSEMSERDKALDYVHENFQGGKALMECRFCKAELTHTFLDLGFAPHSNAYLKLEDLSRPEKYFPLRVKVCDSCWLVQTEDYADADEYFNSDYAYFSSTSSSWLNHARRYFDGVVKKLKLSKDSFVLEVASNDGYLLKNFVAAGIPCLGIEPTTSTADVSEALGVPVLREFFSQELGGRLASQGKKADLIIGNNVYAHVPDINNFTKGLKAALKPGGTITLEFPHLMRLLENSQFDTVYHEHFSYLSLFTVVQIFSASGLRIFDVEELETHGGSLRVIGCHADDPRVDSVSLKNNLAEESRRGLQALAIYQAFQSQAEKIKDDLLTFLIEKKHAGKKVVAYGAAAKGSTLLNYSGVKPDLLEFVCDAADSKQGKYMPGSHVPIYAPLVLSEKNPDYVLILPWNIATEVREELSPVLGEGAKYVVAVPHLEVK